VPLFTKAATGGGRCEGIGNADVANVVDFGRFHTMSKWIAVFSQVAEIGVFFAAAAALAAGLMGLK